MPITYVASNTVATNDATTSIKGTAPTGLLAGQFMLATVAIACAGSSADNPIAAPPAGGTWTEINAGGVVDLGTPSIRINQYYRYVQAGDSGATWTWTSTGVNPVSGSGAETAIDVYSGVDPTTPIVTGEQAFNQQAASSTTHTTASITTAAARWILAAFADKSGSSWTPSDTQRSFARVSGGACSVMTQDSNGLISAGTLSRSAVAQFASSVGAHSILALNPAPDVVVALPINSTLAVGGIRETDAVVALSVPVSLAVTPSGPVTAAVALSTAVALAVIAIRQANAAVPLPITTTLMVAAASPEKAWESQGFPETAHRGGSANWPEETMYAFGNAAAWNPRLALNGDVWQCSTGEYILSHDRSTLRVFGVDLDIPTTPWATLASLRTLVGSLPVARLTDLLNAYAVGSRVLMIDDKRNVNSGPLLDILDTYGGASRFIAKGYLTATQWADAAAARGYARWGYGYSADVSLNFPTYQTHWSLLGMDLTANQTDWNAVLAYGKRVYGHIAATAANAAAAIARGATGLMVSGVQQIVPQEGTTALAALTIEAQLAVIGQSSVHGLAGTVGSAPPTMTGDIDQAPAVGLIGAVT